MRPRLGHARRLLCLGSTLVHVVDTRFRLADDLFDRCVSDHIGQPIADDLPAAVLQDVDAVQEPAAHVGVVYPLRFRPVPHLRAGLCGDDVFSVEDEGQQPDVELGLPPLRTDEEEAVRRIPRFRSDRVRRGHSMLLYQTRRGVNLRAMTPMPTGQRRRTRSSSTTVKRLDQGRPTKRKCREDFRRRR